MTASLAFRTDLALLAAQGAELTPTPEGTVVRMAANPAFRWGNFLLVPRAGDPLDRIAQHRRAFPDVAFTAIGVDDAHAVLDEGAWLTDGFAIDRIVVLTTEVPPVGPDVGVRALSSAADWAAETAIALEEVPAADAAHIDFSRRRTAEKRGMVAAGRAVWLGVERDGEIVATAGIADAGGRVARFQDVQTRAAHRRGGFASGLLATGVRIAAERFRSTRFVLVAERDGPAIGLYRRLGFREIETQLQLTRLDPPDGALGPVGAGA